MPTRIVTSSLAGIGRPGLDVARIVHFILAAGQDCLLLLYGATGFFGQDYQHDQDHTTILVSGQDHPNQCGLVGVPPSYCISHVRAELVLLQLYVCVGCA